MGPGTSAALSSSLFGLVGLRLFISSLLLIVAGDYSLLRLSAFIASVHELIFKKYSKWMFRIFLNKQIQTFDCCASWWFVMNMRSVLENLTRLKYRNAA